MSNPLILKLKHGAPLKAADRESLEDLLARPVSVPARELIANERDACRSVVFLVSGWACRFRNLPRGSRQIVGLMLPGDHTAAYGDLDHDTGCSILALTRCEIVQVSRGELAAWREARPEVDRALLWASMVDESVLTEWLVGLGRRSAERRLAHMICELQARLDAVGLAEPGGYTLPLTQSALSDMLGLSPAHLNRTLHSLRDAGLMSLQEGFVAIPDIDKLRKYAEFNPRYLHRSAPVSV